MSHDRGCYCGRENYEYHDCLRTDCPKLRRPSLQSSFFIAKTKEPEMTDAEDDFDKWWKSRRTNMGISAGSSMTPSETYSIARMAWFESTHRKERPYTGVRSSIPTDHQITEAFNTR